MMIKKKLNGYIFPVAFILSNLFMATTYAQETSYTAGKWTIVISNNGLADVNFDGKTLLENSQASFKQGSTVYLMSELTGHIVEETVLEDERGVGKTISIKALTDDGKINASQYYYLYNNQNYLLTEFTIESEEEISSNYMAPLVAEQEVNLLGAGSNHSLWVPYDNDKWVRYHLYDFGSEPTSYEVAALFNAQTREGLIAGSVEHSTWKTGVKSTTTAPDVLNRLEVFGGVTSFQTRDVLPHGAVKGLKINSPLIMLGWFDDWRTGMETYAMVNEMISPRLPWAEGTPFLWNSWGAIQTSLSYTDASEVAQYFSQTLKPAGFVNDSTVYVGLDSYWDNITYSDLVKFVRETKTRGLDAGIYWTPFVDWARNPDRPVEGSTNIFYRDIYLYANGVPQEIAGAYAIDPTHPVSKQRMNLYLNRFISQGFTFLKLDFLTHGSLESDSYYNPDVTTGKQAYNEGLKYIADYLDGRMFINFSIAPLFPGGQYAHSRRIACDAYAAIGDTEYTLNSLTYGWWLDHVYSYNDADNIVLSGVTLGENRARVTSSVITGIVCSGDDFSSDGPSTARQRAEIFLTNNEVNNIARVVKAFYPVEPAAGGNAADIFVQHHGDTTYLAVFNYTTTSVTKNIDLGRLGIVGGENYMVQELWSNEKNIHSMDMDVFVPRRDVKLFKIYEYDVTSVEHETIQETVLYPNPFSDQLFLSKGTGDIKKMIIFNASGQIVKWIDNPGESVSLVDLKSGLYLITLISDGNDTKRIRVMKM